MPPVRNPEDFPGLAVSLAAVADPYVLGIFPPSAALRIGNVNVDDVLVSIHLSGLRGSARDGHDCGCIVHHLTHIGIEAVVVLNRKARSADAAGGGAGCRWRCIGSTSHRWCSFDQIPHRRPHAPTGLPRWPLGLARTETEFRTDSPT